MPKNNFDINIANDVVINVANNVLKVKWIEFYNEHFTCNQSKSLIYSEIELFTHNLEVPNI